jgi:RNA polymerase sigma-70 factor (ECF subfamily)
MPPRDAYDLAPLLEQSRTGDGPALNALLGKLRPYLQALVRSWLGPDLARALGDSDIVQEALLRVSGNFANFRGQGVPELLGWLRQITFHAVVDRQRKTQAEGRLAGPLPAEVPSPELMPPEVLGRAEDAARLAAALAQLPPQRREVVQLRLLDGLEFAAISERMGKSAGALRVLFLRAIRQLRLTLENPA